MNRLTFSELKMVFVILCQKGIKHIRPTMSYLPRRRLLDDAQVILNKIKKRAFFTTWLEAIVG